MSSTKTNMVDYIEWRGDLTLEQDPFNEVDSILLSTLAYLDFSFINDSHLNFKNAYKRFNRLPDSFRLNGPSYIMQQTIDLFNLMSKTKRFSDLKIGDFINIIDEEREMQFSATCFYLTDNTVFVSFRGTDNTLVAWKEDFNMCFSDGVPAQIEATNYLTKILRKTDLAIRLGGHSKGGNLAVWAGATIPDEFKARIIEIYSNDGPGFMGSFLKNEKYLSIRDRVKSFVPESSIVGVLMNHDSYTTILSLRPSLLQHDPFSWRVLGNHFLTDKTRTKSGKRLEKQINTWVWSMTKKEREEFIESLYTIITTSNIKTLDDIDNAKIKSLISMQRAFLELSKDKQTNLLKCIGRLLFNKEWI